MIQRYQKLPLPAYKPAEGAAINGASISSGLVLSCLFNEGTGTSIADNTSSPLIGTLSAGSIWGTDDTYTNVLNFDGSAYGAIPHDSKISIETYTISLAFKTTSTTNYGVLVDKSSSTKSTYKMFFGYPSAGNLTFDVYDGSNDALYTADSTYNDDDWHKLIFSREQGGDMNIYVDGVLQGQGDDTTTLGATVNTEDLVIAREAGTGRRYTGSFAYLNMWNRVLSGAPGSVGSTATGEIAAITADEFLMYR